MNKQEWRAERFRLASKRRSMHQCATKHVKRPYINSRLTKTNDSNNKFNSDMSNVCFDNGLHPFVAIILILIGALSLLLSFIFPDRWVEIEITLAVGMLGVFIGDLIWNYFVKRDD